MKKCIGIFCILLSHTLNAMHPDNYKNAYDLINQTAKKSLYDENLKKMYLEHLRKEFYYHESLKQDQQKTYTIESKPKPSYYANVINPMVLLAPLYGYFFKQHVSEKEQQAFHWKKPFEIRASNGYAKTGENNYFVMKTRDSMQIYDIKNHKLILSYSFNNNTPLLLWVPDGSWCVIVDGKEAHCFELATGTRKDFICGAHVEFLKSSSGEIRLITSFDESSLRVIDVIKGKQVHIQRGDNTIVRYEFFDNYLMVHYSDKRIVVYDALKKYGVAFYVQAKKYIACLPQCPHSPVSKNLIIVDDELRIFDTTVFNVAQEIYRAPHKGQVNNFFSCWSAHQQEVIIIGDNEIPEVHALKSNNGPKSLLLDKNAAFAYPFFSYAFNYICLFFNVDGETHVAIYPVQKEKGLPLKTIKIKGELLEMPFLRNDICIDKKKNSVVMCNLKNDFSREFEHDNVWFKWSPLHHACAWSINKNSLMVCTSENFNAKTVTLRENFDQKNTQFDAFGDYIFVPVKNDLMIFDTNLGQCIATVDIEGSIKKMCFDPRSRYCAIVPSHLQDRVIILDKLYNYSPVTTLNFKKEIIEMQDFSKKSEVFYVKTNEKYYMYLLSDDCGGPIEPQKK